MDDTPEKLQFDIWTLLIFVTAFAVLVTIIKAAGAFADPRLGSLQDFLTWIALLGVVGLASTGITIKVNAMIRK
jgi:hypothetical protein